MTREEKSNMIESIKSNLDSNSTVYLADCSGLDADSTSKLRRACFKSNIKLSVVKNTLLFRAMEEVDKDFGELKSLLKGNTTLMLSDIGNAPAKVIKNFRKKSEKPILKGAFVEESIYLGDDLLETLVNIKSKEELLGEIVSLLQSPTKNLISALKSSGSKISGVLKTLSEKNENN
jgi:large subunit ribosomal protein L10